MKMFTFNFEVWQRNMIAYTLEAEKATITFKSMPLPTYLCKLVLGRVPKNPRTQTFEMKPDKPEPEIC